MLLQDAGRATGGIRGSWIDAPPVPGTFVINVGEVLELARNGYLRATVHRVVSPPAGTDRLSVAFFFGARLDASVPLLTCRPSWRDARGLTQGSAQPAVSRGRQELPQGPLAFASRCRPTLLCRCADARRTAAQDRQRLIHSSLKDSAHVEKSRFDPGRARRAGDFVRRCQALEPLRVAADPVPHAQILAYIQKIDPQLNSRSSRSPTA